MDLLQSVRIATIPPGLRIVLIVATLGILALNMLVIANGLNRATDDYWIAAGAQLLGAMLPILFIGLLVGFAHGGQRALKDRTAQFLVRDIPAELQRVCEPASPQFVAARPRRWGRWARIMPAPGNARTNVELAFEHQDCVAEYRLTLKADQAAVPVLLRFRIEINVRKANLVLWFPGRLEGQLQPLAIRLADSELSTRADWSDLADVPFGNTIIGALKSGYSINARLLARDSVTGPLTGLVLIRDLATDFLWNPAEQLFFAQDLVFLFRAMVSEARRAASQGIVLFDPAPSGSGQGSAPQPASA
jgi:hypothetical protein